MTSLPFSLYSAAWRLAPLFLRGNARLKEGWEERTLRRPLPRADLWIQAASVGEAFLAEELLKAISAPLTVLLTTNTSQGRAVLEKLAGTIPGLDLSVAYCPLDDPRRMRLAVDQVRPRAVVLLESEIWPGLLKACRRARVPSLLLNGRMSDRSLRRYLKLPKFFRSLAPDRILAMSPADGARFAQVFGRERVGIMSNIKFDRMRAKESSGENPLAGLFRTERGDSPLAVLGSVRQEEEPWVLDILTRLLSMRPRAVVGLFPRHMHRLDFWRETLKTRGVPFTLRSACQGPAEPGSVLLWDVFGEMGRAYDLARAAFVGGSLAPLGGQNFLEPLAAGLRPAIGPHWANFAWVGREIVDQGLVFEARDPDEVLARLLMDLDQEPERDAVRARFEAWLAPRRGGSAQAAALVAEILKSGYHARIPNTESETP